MSQRWNFGRKVLHPIRMSGAISEFERADVYGTAHRGCREVKFGALMDRLISKDSWLATGEIRSFMSYS